MGLAWQSHPRTFGCFLGEYVKRHRGDVLDFASGLRVTCLRYLRRKLAEAEGEKLDVNGRPAARQSTLRNTH